MTRSARLYQCARCHSLVLICSHCDHGQQYCNRSCSKAARLESQRLYANKKRKDPEEKKANAKRQQRYRACLKKSNATGFDSNDSDDLLKEDEEQDDLHCKDGIVMQPPRCHWCGCICDVYFRNGFIRYPLKPASIPLLI